MLFFFPLPTMLTCLLWLPRVCHSLVLGVVRLFPVLPMFDISYIPNALLIYLLLLPSTTLFEFLNKYMK